ncbi:MAG: TetR/AcrR family transcriptional regulator [Actinomycetota bacterium]
MVQSRAPRKRTVKPPEQRREEILESALALFRDRGFDETTVQDIAAAAGVAAGTVYLYFPSKEHVLVAIHEEFHKGMEDRFASVWESLLKRADAGEKFDRRTVIDSLLDELVAYALDNRDTCTVIARFVPRLHEKSWADAHQTEHAFDRLMAEAFRQAIEEGHVHTSDPEMTALIVNAGINHTIGHAIAFGDPPDLDRIVAQAKEIYYKVLAP